MYTITKEFRFEAAHRLVGHDGKCARLHGHSWVARVAFRGAALHGHGPKEGMLADFGDVKALVQPYVDKFLDHHYLNETLNSDRPTSEFVAVWLFNELLRDTQSLKSRAGAGFALAELAWVEVRETCTSSCVVDMEGGRRL